MSVSSSSSSSLKANQDCQGDIDALASRIQQKFSIPITENLPVAQHRKATDAMLRLRDAIAKGGATSPSHHARMCLTCAGIVVQRRLAFSNFGFGEEVTLKTTLALLFTLLIMLGDGAGGADGADGADGAGEPTPKSDNATPEAEATDACVEIDAEAERAVSIAAWLNSSYADEMQCASSSLTAALNSPTALCRLVLLEATTRAKELTISELAHLGALFFRASSAVLTNSLLSGSEQSNTTPDTFLTLDAVSVLTEVNGNTEERLCGIADCAESEAGQSILRDLILSFKLPRAVTGVRRTSLLSRETNKLATSDYAAQLGSAHDAAMRGARFCYEKDDDEIHKICAILAGVAVSMCTDASSIRKHDMFAGRVSFPFLETATPPPGVVRFAFVEHEYTSFVYEVATSGRVKVHGRWTGIDGFFHAILFFSSKI